jgi:16S rRNA (guanine966-N2)-methyltransferase
MREALFAGFAERVTDCRFADLYAGCGSVGIEALSRGAAACVFVERDHHCVTALGENLAHTRLSDAAQIRQGSVERVWTRVAEELGPFDIVFADPPYGLRGFEEFARRLAVFGEGVASGGMVVLQYNADAAAMGLPEPTRCKRFGETIVSIYETVRAD